MQALRIKHTEIMKITIDPIMIPTVTASIDLRVQVF